MEENTVNEETAMISFGIIAVAGVAKSAALEALAASQAGDFEKADELIKQSEEAALEAHHKQTDLLSREAAGDHTPVDVMLVHAQDHLMCAMLAKDLIKGMIEQNKKIAALQA